MSRKLVYKGSADIEFPDDVERLRLALSRQGYTVAPGDIQAAYGAWSQANWSAGWMMLPDDSETVDEWARSMVAQGYLVTSATAPPRGE